ncbi:unnamed protein product [marine sediment metagenome]|uniref:Uncharacterized protein n=1 Tax=marine sediment metagenome TaxID=412755 RepID=X0UPY6_9ZZZZ
MPTLITPVQYEPALEELNAVRPLRLQERPRISLDIPIINKLPKESVKSIAGTLAKGTPSGALLKLKKEYITAYQMQAVSVTTGYVHLNIVFSQVVKKVMVNVTSLGNTTVFYWSTDNFLVVLQDLNSIKVHYLPFVGTNLYIYYAKLSPGQLVFNVYGFY